jgi:hypothetical protein
LKSLEVGVLDSTIDKYIDKFINIESLDVRLEDGETNKTFENISKPQHFCFLKIFLDKPAQDRIINFILNHQNAIG